MFCLILQFLNAFKSEAWVLSNLFRWIFLSTDETKRIKREERKTMTSGVRKNINGKVKENRMRKSQVMEF